MQTDRSAPDLEPVEDEVVAPAEDLARVLVEEVDAVVVRASEGVVGGDPAALLVVVLEQRRVDDPEEVPLSSVPRLRDEPELLREVNAQVRHHRLDGGLAAELEEHEIAVGDAEARR